MFRVSDFVRSFRIRMDEDGCKRMRAPTIILIEWFEEINIRRQFFFCNRNNIWAFTLFTLNSLHLYKVRMTQTSNRINRETVDNDNSCSNNVKFNWFTILFPIYDFPFKFTTISVWICFSSFYVYLKCLYIGERNHKSILFLVLSWRIIWGVESLNGSIDWFSSVQFSSVEVQLNWHPECNIHSIQSNKNKKKKKAIDINFILNL